MEKIELCEKEAIEYVKDMLLTYKKSVEDVKNAKYHHNTLYENTPSIIRDGILSKSERLRLENRSLNDKEKLIYYDENCVNGLDNISLSVVGLNDLYRDELEYSPLGTRVTDILISSDIMASRCTQNYGNEFLVSKMIKNSDFRSIDVRLLTELDEIYQKKFFRETKEQKLNWFIQNYNYLKLIAQALIDNNLDIPLREMSNENITLDIYAVAKGPELVLK